MTPEAELEAELIDRGFEPTDQYTDTGRLWRKRGVRPPVPYIVIPFSIQGHYPDWLMQDNQRRIRLINDWMRPRLTPDRDATDC